MCKFCRGCAVKYCENRIVVIKLPKWLRNICKTKSTLNKSKKQVPSHNSLECI